MLTDHAQNLQGCEKCNLRKAVGNLEMPYGCEITVIVQEVWWTDEVHSSGWKLVFNESTVLFQRKSTSTITIT